MAISEDLGSEKEVGLANGSIRYRERGSGTPIVFVHGLLVNGDLWRKVVPDVARHHRCITPDLPLGAHSVAMNDDADLSIAGLAQMLAEFLNALDLEDVTLVANDTGGAVTQVLITEHPERVGGVVLTSCDAYENFLPLMFRPLQWLAWVPPLLTAIVQPLRFPMPRRLPLAFGWLSKRPIDREFEDGYLAPFFASSAIRRDTYKVLRDISPHYTMKAAEKLPNFDKPALIVWANEDRFFPPDDGRKLADALPKARYVEVSDAFTFISEDNPEPLVEYINQFLCLSESAGAAR